MQVTFFVNPMFSHPSSFIETIEKRKNCILMTHFSFSITVQPVPTASSIRFLFKTRRSFLFWRLCRSGFRKLNSYFLQHCRFLLNFFKVKWFSWLIDFQILFFLTFSWNSIKAFCEKAPASVRASFAFRIYGNFKFYVRLFNDVMNWRSFSKHF